MFKILSTVFFCIFTLAACHTYKDEASINDEEGMDPNVRQIMMEEESEAPTEEEGIIYAPSDFIHAD